MEDRTAQILADCIDELEKGQTTLEEILDRYPDSRSEFESLLGLVANLREAPTVKPSLHYRLHSRRTLTNSLTDHNETERNSNFIIRIIKMKNGVTSWRNPMLARALVIGGILVFTSVASVQAAHKATPGSPFYPVKAGIETLQLALADEEGDLNLRVRFAQNRNEEITWLSEQGRFADIAVAQEIFGQYVVQASDGFTSLPGETSDPDQAILAEKLDGTIKKNISVLEGVLEKVPEQAKPAIEHALENARNQQPGWAHPQNQPAQILNTSVPTDLPTQDAAIDPTVDPSIKTNTSPTVEPPVQEKPKPTQKPTKEKPNNPLQGTQPTGHTGNDAIKTPPGYEKQNDPPDYANGNP